MKQKITIESMARSVVRELKKLRGNAWGQYAHNVQRGESLVHGVIVDMISDLAEDKVDKLSITELAMLHDAGDTSCCDDEVEDVFEKYANEGGMPIKDFLGELKMQLRDSVRMLVEGEVARIAADANLEKLDDGY